MDITNPVWRSSPVPPPWPCESWKATNEEVSKLKRCSVVAGPWDSDQRVTVLARPGSGCGRRACRLAVGRLASAGSRLYEVVDVQSWAPVGCFFPWRTGRLTVGRNMRCDSHSSSLRVNEYEGKKWRHYWGLWFYWVRLEFMRQGIAGWPSRVWRRVHITSTVALRVVKGDGKGTHCLGI
jgi:hypothetical protein